MRTINRTIKKDPETPVQNMAQNSFKSPGRINFINGENIGLAGIK